MKYDAYIVNASMVDCGTVPFPVVYQSSLRSLGITSKSWAFGIGLGCLLNRFFPGLDQVWVIIASLRARARALHAHVRKQINYPVSRWVYSAHTKICSSTKAGRGRMVFDVAKFMELFLHQGFYA